MKEETYLKSPRPDSRRRHLAFLLLRRLQKSLTQRTQKDRIETSRGSSHLVLYDFTDPDHRRNDILVTNLVAGDSVEDPFSASFERETGVAVAGEGVEAGDFGFGGDDGAEGRD